MKYKISISMKKRFIAFFNWRPSFLYLNSGTVYACTQRTISVLASNSSSSDETVSSVKDDELTESTFEFEVSFSDKSLDGVE